VRKGIPLPAGGSGEGAVSPPQEILNFSISKWCFGIFCGVKFNILVTTKSCKNHTLNARGTSVDMTKRNKHLSSFFSNFTNEH